MADYKYHCDKCDEGFNLNSKLKRHILSDHGENDDDLQLTKEEKIKLFDDLKERYLEASDKYSQLETKFQSLQSKLKSLSLKNNFKQKNYRGLDDTVGSYEHIETDETIPSGWKSSWKKLDFCKKKSKIYWAPNGKFCSSRREAILYMVEQLHSPAEDVLQMKAGLIHDGWKEDKVLAGWYFRKVNTGKEKISNVFISSDLTHFKSPKAVLAHLLKFSSEKEISEFIISHLRTDVSSLQWLYSPDIPFPWRVAFMNGTKFQLYFSTEGSVFTNLRSAVEFMMKDSEVTAAQRKSFSDLMEGKIYQMEMDEGDWVRDETLPQGWMKIKKPGQAPSYLSPEGVVLGTKVGVQEYLKRSSSVSAVSEMRGLTVKQETVWQSGDQSVPEGWLVSADGKRFKDPAGKHFFSRLEALKSMENYSAEDRQKMKEGLTSGNWSSKNLPSGWLVKKNKKGEKFYLAPSLEIVKTLENVIKIMKEEGRDEEEIDKVKSAAGWSVEPNFPEGWRVSLPSMSLSHQKRFLDPEGKIFLGTRQVYQHHLTSSPVDEEAVKKVRECLVREGWDTSQFLPDRWMLKRSETGGKEYKAQYLSEKGEKFKNAEKAVTYLISNNFSAEIIEKFKENALSTKYYAGDNLPAGWKVGEAPVGHGRKAKRFLSPEGKFLVNRAAAGKYMLENNYSQEDIALIRAGFQEDGWHLSEKLPPGFLVRIKTEGGERSKPQFLNIETFHIIHRLREMVSHLKENDYSPETIEKIKTISRTRLAANPDYDISDESLEIDDSLVMDDDEELLSDNNQRDTRKESSAKNSTKLQWNDDETSLPRGWKISEMKNTFCPGNDKMYYKLLTPAGVYLNSRAQAVRFMKEKPGEFTAEDTEFMISNLHRDGWIRSDNLPHNWMYRFLQKSMHFLNENFEQLRSFSKAYRYMEINGYSPEVLDRFKVSFFRTQKEVTLVKTEEEEGEIEISDQMSEKRKTSCEISAEPDIPAKRPKLEESSRSIQWKRDQTLPDGWLLLATDSEGEIIKTSDGVRFSGRKEAIDFMIKEGYSPESIFKLWNTLHLDGWLDDPQVLPTGWKKKLFSDNSGYHFLSPLMEEITGTEGLLAHMEKNHSEYDAEDLTKLKNWIAEVF